MSSNPTKQTDSTDVDKRLHAENPQLAEFTKDIIRARFDTGKFAPSNSGDDTFNKFVIPAAFSSDGNSIYFNQSNGDNAQDCNGVETYKSHDQHGDHLRRDNTTERVVDSNGTLIVQRDIATGLIKNSTDSFEASSANSNHSLHLKKNDGTSVTIDSDSSGNFTITTYDHDGNCISQQIDAPRGEVQKLFNSGTLVDSGSFNEITDIATLTHDGKSVMFDFHNGAFAIDGFGPGNFVFNADGSTTMPDGSIVLKNGKIIMAASFHLYAGKSDETVIAIQAEAQNYMTDVLAKIAGGIPVTSADISALSNCYSALGAAGMASIAASIMQGAVGGVMNDAAAQLVRFFAAKDHGVSSSGDLALAMGALTMTPEYAAKFVAQSRQLNIDYDTQGNTPDYVAKSAALQANSSLS